MYHSQDTIFSVKALVFAKTAAVVPGAVYHCLNRPTSLSKGGAKLVDMRGNNPAARAEFEKFKADNYIAKYFTDAPENDKPLQTTKITVFGLPVMIRKVFIGKTKYYLFGLIYVARKRTV
jgi:hypothetical protein